MSTELCSLVQAKITIDDIQAFKTQAEFIPKLLTMQELTSLEILGPVKEEIDEFFAKGGWAYNAYPLAI